MNPAIRAIIPKAAALAAAKQDQPTPGTASALDAAAQAISKPKTRKKRPRKPSPHGRADLVAKQKKARP